MLLGDVLEVSAHLGLLGVVLAPGVILFEVVLVGQAGSVNPSVRVLMDAPHAPDFVSSFEDGERDAQRVQLCAGGEAAEASTDDGHVEAGRDLRLAVGPGGAPWSLVEG